jgi:hypothetical protein
MILFYDANPGWMEFSEGTGGTDRPSYIQAVLAENRINRTKGADAKYPSLLAGLVFDDSGERLTPAVCTENFIRID